MNSIFLPLWQKVSLHSKVVCHHGERTHMYPYLHSEYIVRVINWARYLLVNKLEAVRHTTATTLNQKTIDTQNCLSYLLVINYLAKLSHREFVGGCFLTISCSLAKTVFALHSSTPSWGRYPYVSILWNGSKIVPNT